MVSSRVNFTKEDIGAEILPILTTGLYRNTLDALREYVQNAVDADAATIEFAIDPDVVSIVDTGNGMSREQARNAIRFGVSDKSPLENVGFRGIGIYSAFNICNSLEIYTKSQEDPNTYKLTFDFFWHQNEIASRAGEAFTRNAASATPRTAVGRICVHGIHRRRGFP